MNQRTALVTGASRGIGSRIADRLQSAGAKILKPSRRELDLLSSDSIATYLENLKEPVDILVNNAGINKLGSAFEIAEADLQETLQINLIAPVMLIRGVASGMTERKYGRIVNISSIWSKISRPLRGPYSASKAGLNGITRTLALELAPYNVLVNAVAPGYVNTELTKQNNSAEEIVAIGRSIPMQRLAEPGEIAELVAFLCSSRNSYMTGQTLVIDGGFICQ